MEKEKKEKKDNYVKRLMNSYREGNKKTFTVLKVLLVMVLLTAIYCYQKEMAHGYRNQHFAEERYVRSLFLV